MATARDLMTPNPTTITPDASLVEAARAMRDGNIGALPVAGGADGALGIITDRDLVIRGLAEENCATLTVGDITTQNVVSVEADASEDEVVRAMGDNQVLRVLVTEGGQLVGIISKQNIAQNAPSGEVGHTMEQVTQG